MIILIFIVTHSENLYMQMADHLVSDGFKELGYQYVNIDVSYLS